MIEHPEDDCKHKFVKERFHLNIFVKVMLHPSDWSFDFSFGGLPTFKGIKILFLVIGFDHYWSGHFEQED